MVQSHHPYDLKAAISVMALDHKAAYLNAEIKGPSLEMMLNSEVAGRLCEINPRNRQYKFCSGRITVQTEKALHGRIESALLRNEELKSTLSWMIFTDDLYDICSFARSRRSGGRERGRREWGLSAVRIFEYLTDLVVSSDATPALDDIEYDVITSHPLYLLFPSFSRPHPHSLTLSHPLSPLFPPHLPSLLPFLPSSLLLSLLLSLSPSLSPSIVPSYPPCHPPCHPPPSYPLPPSLFSSLPTSLSPHSLSTL